MITMFSQKDLSFGGGGELSGFLFVFVWFQADRDRILEGTETSITEKMQMQKLADGIKPYFPLLTEYMCLIVIYRSPLYKSDVEEPI